ncbi:hypothetical protein CHARACLAT_000309 [Characodon lateralis]|uniref:Polycystic kidney disease protein 1-like 1 n=1 Tax=Characodon lateralis TaxID=208331 RepID=A0ABU7DEZ2_9TELE|nr:hypothetical protein [Characodon lateralis]
MSRKPEEPFKVDQRSSSRCVVLAKGAQGKLDSDSDASQRSFYVLSIKQLIPLKLTNEEKQRLLQAFPKPSLFAHSRFVCTSFSIHCNAVRPPHSFLDTQAVRAPCGPLSGADMLAALLIVALGCLHSASTSPPGQEVSLRFLCCVNTSSIQAFTPTGARDLEPMRCSARCLHEGPIYYLPLGHVGNGNEGSVALHRGQGPFLLYMSVSVCAERAQAGRTSGVKGSGKLAGCWKHTTDVEDVEKVSCSRSDCLKSILVVVCPFISNLSLEVSDYQLTADDVVSEDIELLKLAVEAESNQSCENPKDCIGTEKYCSHELFFDIPRGVTSDQTCLVSFIISAESDGTVSLLVNATVKHRSSSCTAGAKATVVLLFDHSGTVVIQLRAENEVSFQRESARMCVKGNRKLQAKDITTWKPPAQSEEQNVVRIYAGGQVHSTNKDIIFLVITDIPDPVEFFWDFGDSKLAKTSLRTITKRYHTPGSYKVVVAASRGQMSVTSDVFPIVVQRAVKLSRLVHQASVLRNRTLTIGCRVNVGTNLTFMWSFGDGTTRPGLSTTHHVFHRLGEFIVKVTASNLISSASLSSHIFVVDRPCQPPPVKNMGPLKRQFQRHEAIHLGVTFETDVDCDISEGLHYTWTLFGSGGQIIPLPHTYTQRQSLILQSHLLQYDTYTAIARVQVIGSVVYSNYTVTFQVKPSPPVAFIQGGTNVFIGKKSSNMVTLDGQKSYDPDFPENLLSYSWTCKPVSTITSSCFDQEIPTSSPVLKFPTSLLKPKFDQFQFTLTVRSGERSASSEAFLTCQGDHVNWDQTFTVSAVCEDCNIHSELIHYAWSLYLVNASSKPIIEVPFCYTVDVSAPFAILADPPTSTLTPEMSSLHPSVTDVSQDHHYADASSPAFLTEKISEATLQPQILYLGDRKTASAESRDKSDMPGSDPSHTPVLDQDTRLLSDHMSFSGVSSEFPTESSAAWKDAFPLMERDHIAGQPANSAASSDDYDVPYPSLDEGDSGMSAGRLSGVDADSISLGDDSLTLNNEGSNLMDPKPSAVILEPTLLDLHRDSVERGQFESYTYTGISSTSIQFKPFSLKPRSLYMLQVTAKFNNDLIGWTQLFLKSNPVPEGMTCQVQPAEGMELHTPFSIFCTSGREDLEYKYSFSVGGRPPRILYQGRDIQYYFSLPSGDPSDGYKVRIYTEIRSSSSGSDTKPCLVTVRVRPSFLRNTSSSSSSHHDPALKLSKSLRNLSTLVQLGNLVEVHNYISLLTSILNRLSRDAEDNTRAQMHIRNVLICTLCKFKGSDEMSMADNIFILNELLQITNQVTITSVRCVASHVRSVSEKLPEFSANQDMLYSLINSLSYCLQVVTSCSCTPETPGNLNNTHVLGPGSLTAQNTKDSESPSAGPHLEHGGEVPAKRLMQLVEEIMQSAADLMLRHILLHEAKVHTVRTGLITLLASTQNRTSTIIRSGFTTIHMPAALIQSVFGFHTGRTRLREQQPCVFRVLTELSHNYYPREKCPPQLQTGRAFTPTSLSQLTGPVVDLSLFNCSTRKKIHIPSLAQPINIEVQLPQRNESSTTQYILHRNQVNYHNFSISQQLLQQAIQVTVVLTPPSSKPFPIMLLFRMFERPTPSMHHLQRIHQWEHNVIRVTLPPSYLNAAGVAHIALLDANFERLPRSKIQREQISYSLTADSSLCVSWDGEQGDWTHHGCRTHQTDTSSAATCSCFQLRPLTVFQQQILSSQDTGDLDPFLSESSNLTVLIILTILLLLYILGLVWSERADAVSKENQRVHYVSDNSPADPFLYAVCIHTGLCSATHMTAKVYIVLYGENGFSQTKELQVPGCTLFRRNTKDTFIVSAAVSLGPVWGVHIWHDNSGPSPDWYLKQVVVSEVNRGQVEATSWVFVSECWLAVSKEDGQVERMLRIGSQEIHLAKTLLVRFSDYLADFHMWLCVYSCPSPSSFTHTQRLSVWLLLVLGYACANTVIISQTSSVNNSELDYHLSWHSRWKWTQEALEKKYQDADILSVSSIHENTGTDEESTIQTGIAKKSLDLLILAVAMIVSFWYKKAAHFHCFFSVRKSQIETNLWNKTDAVGPGEQLTTSALCEETSSSVEKLLWAWQRARCLRLTHPPTPAELRKTRGKRRREALIHETLRDLFFCAIMLLLMVCIISGSSVKEHQNLNKAIMTHFMRSNSYFTSIKTHEDWWKWTRSSLLDLLYQNSSAKTEQPHIVIGEAIIEKKDISNIQNAMLTNPWTCDHPCSEKAATVRFGHTKSEAASELKTLHSSSWISRQTVALKVQFTLYSPAPHLFSSVSLITEQSPDGALLHSVKVQSVKVLHTPALWDHVSMVCKLLFLLFSLLQPCNQVFTVAQQGLMGYWTRPCMWLDVSLLTVTLVCYACFIHHSTMIMEVVSLLQTQHRGHVDVSAVANWEQKIRTLWGVIFFLLTMKCVTVLKVSRTLSSSAAVISQTLSSLLWPVVSGLILLLALSCSSNLLHAESSWAFSSVPRSLQTLLCHYRGPRVTKSALHVGQGFPHWAVLCLTTTAVWMIVITGAISLLVKTAKISQSRNFNFTTGELFCYLRMKVSEFTGRQRQSRTDDNDKRRTNVLEELEISVDELLFRLNVLSSSMHHTLRAHCHREETSPFISALPQSPNMDTQERLSSRIMVKNPKTGNKSTHEAHEGATPPASHLLRSQVEIQNVLNGKNEMLDIKTWLPTSESTSLERLWAEDICENQPEMQTRSNDRRWFTKTHSKVVEVLVHKEPGTGEP